MERSQAIRYNYTDLLSLPESHERHEIIDGELFVTPTPRYNHQRVAANLVLVLGPLLADDDLGEIVGPMTVHLHDELVLEPDLIFVRRDRMGIVDPEGWVHGPPDLVVEILSPSTADRDHTLKRKRYLESGVQELWLVDIDARAVTVWRSGVPKPQRVEHVLRWRVGDQTLELPLERVFEGLR